MNSACHCQPLQPIETDCVGRLGCRQHPPGVAAGLAIRLLRDRERVISIVGAGGKTSLMYRLCQELSAAGQYAISTTTTQIQIPTADLSPCLWLLSEHGWPRLTQALSDHRHVTLAARRQSNGKLKGLNQSQFQRLVAHPAAQRIVIEADGAMQCPLKAPAAHEPVVPESADLVIGVVGLDAIGMPLSRETVFRPELFSACAGIGLGEAITAESVIRLILHRQGLFKGCPAAARTVVLFNKLDLAHSTALIDDLSAAARGLSGRRIDAWLAACVQQNRVQTLAL